MSKPRYGNEEGLRKYIRDIIKHRNNKYALSYIETKLEHYSFSDEFISWCDDICKKLRNNIANNSGSRTVNNKPILESLPEIFFNSLTEAREKEHLNIARQHIAQAQSYLSATSEKTENALFNVKDDIRYSSASDKLDLVKEYQRLASHKSLLTKEAEYADLTLKNPYFGRFDFKDSSGLERVLYISKTNISQFVSDHHNVYFVDWRSPIAELFYRYQSPTKNVSYITDKKETISGDLALTARFQIENGIITNISYSADPNNKSVPKAAEDILQEKLSDNSEDYMTEIVETIQPEQNEIVRQKPEDDMIVQGVAGSGKTAVALHRIAYIIYKRPELKHGGVLFISPNDTFSEYVSNVLPELGEFYIPIITFDKATNFIFNGSLTNSEGSTNETLKDFVEKYYQNNKLDQNIKTKFTAAFSNKFYHLCDKIQNNGSLIQRYFIIRDEIESIKKDTKLQNELITSYKNTIAKHIGGEKEREAREKIPDAIVRKEKLKKSLSAYRKSFYAISKKIENSEGIYKIKKAKAEEGEQIVSIKLAKTAFQYFKTLCNNENTNIYSYENAPYIAILHFLVDQANGKNHENLSVKHIVIDEAQDYIEPYIYFLRIAYPNATFTILGDINQNINPYCMNKTIKTLLPNANYFEMDKAYRSSPEIVNFCNNILNITSVKPVRLSNNETVEEFTNSNVIETIQAAVNYYTKKDYKRIGIITRNQEATHAISSTINDKKVMILPVYQAKGLEYDAAIVIDDYKDNEKELYYVACSRAQHGLTVIHEQKKQHKTIQQADKKPTTNALNTTKEETNITVNNTINTTTTVRTKSQSKSFFSKLKAAAKAAAEVFRENS